jgi:hypothetical protein
VEEIEEPQAALERVDSQSDTKLLFTQGGVTEADLSRNRREEALPPRTDAALWVPDDAARDCSLCGAVFSLTKRKVSLLFLSSAHPQPPPPQHHCRHCGNVFCDRCSSRVAKLPDAFGFASPQRVCDTCFALLAQSEAKGEQGGGRGARVTCRCRGLCRGADVCV